MVDLVKIRKKAKERKGESSEPASANEDVSTGTSTSDRKRSSAKKASGGKKKKAGKKTKKSPTARKDQKVAEPGEQNTETGAPAVAEADIEVPAAPEPTQEAVPESHVDEETRLSEFKRTAGVTTVDEREVVKEESEDESGEELLELITFVLAGEQYAMEVEQLVEIIVPRRWTHVPNADETVIGIISLRGSIVTLIDLRRLLGHPGRGEETEDTRIIVVRNESEQVGFIVDRVLRVVKVDEASIEPHPVVSSSEQNEAVKGVFVSGDTITIYLDLERITG